MPELTDEVVSVGSGLVELVVVVVALAVAVELELVV